ncbi:MAG TPA: hypothetical protein DEV87_00600 [Clostridiales bacterium]|nr:hypothetical protein [Clostridiales bacterium]
MRLKKMLIGILTVLALLCVSVAAVGCGGEPTVESVELNKTSAEFFVGESLNYGDYKVTVKYSDGNTETVDLKESMISQTDLSKLSTAGTYEINVTVRDKTVTLTVTVKKYDFDGEGIVFHDINENEISATYTGEAIIPELENLPLDAQVNYDFYEGSDESGTPIESVIDAGVYFVKATVVQAKYKDFVLSAKLNVRKKLIDPATLNWKGTSVFYPGSKVTLAATVEGLPEGIEIDAFGGDATAELPGEYIATVTFKGENKNFYYSDKAYNLKWTVTSDVAYDKWYSINDGVLTVAEFNKDAEDATKGTLSLGADTVDYTVAYDDTTKLPTFTLGADAAVSSITLNGTVLTVVKGETTYKFLFKSFFEKYFGVGYSLYVADFDFVVNETEGTVKAVITSSDGTKNEYDTTMSFTGKANGADTAKFTLAGSDVYFQAGVSNGNFIFTAYNYVNDQNIDSDGKVETDDSFKLVSKPALKEFLSSLIVGEFMDIKDNTLKVTEDNEIYVNGVKSFAFVESDYNGKPQFTVSWDGSNCDKTLTVVDGYYKLDNVFFDKDFKNYVGEYYFVSEGLSDSQTVSFNTSSNNYRVSTKLIVGEETAAESKNFDFNVASNKDRFTITKGEGVLTLNLYLADSEEVYAVVTLKADGTAAVGEALFKKVDRIIEKAGYFDGNYYGADGTKLSYNGKGVFTLGEKSYDDYTLSYNGSEVTVTLKPGETSVVIKYDYTEKRYVTVDGKYFIYDGAGNGNTNGFIFGKDYVKGSNKFKFNNGVLEINGTALTDVSFDFVDDGNDNGRTVLKATGKNGTENVEVLFYSLFAVKVNEDVYVFNNVAHLLGAKYKENADASPVIELTAAGKILYNGTEVLPCFLNLTWAKISIPVSENGFAVKKDVNINDNGLWITLDGKDYYAEAYYTYRGIYKSADKAFYFDTIVYKDGLSKTTGTYLSLANDALVIEFSGDKLATFSVIDGVKTLLYDGETYVYNSFDVNTILGSYQILENTGYASLTISKQGIDDTVIGILLKDGEFVFKIKYDAYKTAYIVKNNDSATSSVLPFLAVRDNIYDVVGSTKVNGKDFVVSVGAGAVDSVTKTVLTVTYDGNKANVARVGNDWKVTLGGIEYKIEKNSGENQDVSSILVYEFWLKNVTGSYTFNGRTLLLETVVNASGENIVRVTVDGVVVNHNISDSHDTMSFVKDGVNYIAKIDAGATLRIALYTMAEYNAFYATFNTEESCYIATVGGKTLVFDYDIKNENISYNPANYAFAFKVDATKYKYGESALVFGQYVYEAGIIVFTTADGNSYAYDINGDVLHTDVLPDNFELVGIKTSGKVYGLDAYNITVTAKLSGFSEGKAVVTVYYEFSSSSDGVRNATTATPLSDGTGYKLVGKTGVGDKEKVVTTYLIKEGAAYELYAEEQYILAGTYAVNEKSLVITGTLKGGKGTYKATYDNGTETAITVDFTKNEFILKTAEGSMIFTFTLNEGVISFTSVVVPDAAIKFLTNGASLAEIGYRGADASYGEIKSITLKEISGSTVKFNVAIGYSTYEGTLSADQSYIDYYYGDRLYLNPTKYDECDFIKISSSAKCLPLLGEHTVNETETIKIALKAETTDDEDEGFIVDSYGAEVTYKGTTVYVRNFGYYSTSVEFKVGATTYVAAVVNGSVTVTEKAAA